MKKIILPILTSLLIGLPASLFANDINTTDVYAKNVDWNYGNKSNQGDKQDNRRSRDKEDDDPNGPNNWSKISPDFVLCGAGKNQSPVNIDTKKTARGQARGIKFNYGLITPWKIENTGNLIRVAINSAGEKAANINVDGIEFKLKHLDLHIPSEHTLDEQHYPMEVQFAHESKEHGLAYVSMMVVPGRPDRTLRKLLQQLPMNAGESKPLPPNALRNTEMKKKLASYYRYSGSSTTPPCTEGAHWFIMKQPLTVSKEQYQKFRAAIKQDNNRPVQDLNARLIVE